MEQVQRQTVETRWFECPEKRRVGTIVYDACDNDWQAVCLREYFPGVYTTHEVRVSIPTEKEATKC
jgi:hypothetical protein